MQLRIARCPKAAPYSITVPDLQNIATLQAALVKHADNKLGPLWLCCSSCLGIIAGNFHLGKHRTRERGLHMQMSSHCGLVELLLTSRSVRELDPSSGPAQGFAVSCRHEPSKRGFDRLPQKASQHTQLFLMYQRSTKPSTERDFCTLQNEEEEVSVGCNTCAKLCEIVFRSNTQPVLGVAYVSGSS